MRSRLAPWETLFAEADRLGMVVVSREKSVRQLAEFRDELIEEAEKLAKLAEAKDLTDQQNARWDAIMAEDTGELAVVSAQLADALARERQRKALAAAKLGQQNHGGSPFQHGGLIDDGGQNRGASIASGPVFKCQTTGKIFRAVTNKQSVGAATPEDQFYGEPPARIGEVLASLLTGRNFGADPSRIQAAIGGSDSGGGFILNPMLGSQVIDLARSASVALRAGAITLPMEAREMHIARIASDPTGHWRAEAVAVPATDMTFDRITLRAKTLAAIIPVSIELIEDAANIVQILELALQSALGLALDQAVLTGAGSENDPKASATMRASTASGASRRRTTIPTWATPSARY